MSASDVHTLPRFLAPVLGATGDEAGLPAAEAHHLTRVLRLGRGDRVAVFDGRGREFAAEILRATAAGVTVRLLEPIVPAAEPAVAITLAQAVLKGTAMDEVVRDATMAGVHTVEPIVSDHVAVGATVLGRAAVRERWQRVALASTKQCRRATVPEVRSPRPFRDWIADRGHPLRLILVEPAAAARTRSMKFLLERAAPAAAALLVGPEGGWSRSEIEAAVDAGCTPVSLGSLTLRADAVALAAISLFRVLSEPD